VAEDDRNIELLRELVELESPTGEIEPLQRLGARLAEELDGLGADVEPHGLHLQAELDGDGEPLLLLAHFDTVWPLGTLEEMPFRIEGDRAHGPGAYDMKAGIVTILAALREAGPRRRAVRIFLGADEERGSLESRILIERASEGVAAGLVLEPCLPGGGLKIQRKGLGKFHVTVKGIQAHAGTNPDAGASAIDELARQVLRLHELSDDERGIHVNVGTFEGGIAGNVIADRAEADVDVRIVHAEDAPELERKIRSLEPELDGTEIDVYGGYTRPPLEPSELTDRLLAKAQEHGRALGLELAAGGSGGGSDGNLVGALGIPVLDGLGPDGAGAHARHEHVLLPSLPQRIALLARLLADPGV
jgi:glutamate carboxypeptidase